MAAKAEFRIPNFEKVDVTMTITMSVAEWREVRARLYANEGNGQWYFKDGIARMIDQLDISFRFYETDTLKTAQ